MGMGGDEDDWTWEGIRDTIRLHYSTSEIALPSVPVKQIMISDVIYISSGFVARDSENRYRTKSMCAE